MRIILVIIIHPDDEGVDVAGRELCVNKFYKVLHFTGGRSADKRAQEGTFLAREREWRELPGQIADVMKKHETVSSRLAENHEAANRLKKQLQNLGEQAQQLARQKQGGQAEVDQAGRALEQMAVL